MVSLKSQVPMTTITNCATSTILLAPPQNQLKVNYSDKNLYKVIQPSL